MSDDIEDIRPGVSLFGRHSVHLVDSGTNLILGEARQDFRFQFHFIHGFKQVAGTLEQD